MHQHRNKHKEEVNEEESKLTTEKNYTRNSPEIKNLKLNLCLIYNWCKNIFHIFQQYLIHINHKTKFIFWERKYVFS